MIIHLDKGKPLGLFGCYYKNETLTKEALGGSVYNTGDLAYYDEDGYIWFVGRQDDVIKSTGYRISPFEVESVLMRFPGVLECAVTGVEDAKRGQIVKATIVLVPAYKDKDKKEMEVEISTFAKENTAMYKIPRIYEFVDELPKTISGKIRSVEIREKDKGKDIEKIKQDF
jgi:acetyl-CoA synthetase